MFSPYEKEMFGECARECSRWYFRNQNSNENPWGGMKDSADKGRFVYEYFVSDKTGRGAGVWAQALGIMALEAANLRERLNIDVSKRTEASELAGDYMLSLQYKNTGDPENFGGFGEHVPGDPFSYPRDAATGGLGLNALYRSTKDEKYLVAAKNFAEWYKNYGCDAEGWPYITFDFLKKAGTNLEMSVVGESDGTREYVQGDWQAGGGLFYYYLAAQTGDRKYIDDYLMPMINKMVKIYEDNPYDGAKPGFHGEVPISFGNDDFALVTLLGAYLATKNSDYLDLARERIMDFFKYWDADSGRFPSFGGTFVSGITLKVLKDLDISEGRKVPEEIDDALHTIAMNGLELQAFDYNDVRINGGFWGQTEYGVSRDRIHHRSTGYASIFYSMMEDIAPIPYYHCMHWDIPSK